MSDEEKQEVSEESAAADAAAGDKSARDPAEMTEAELREALEKQFREQQVGDMLVQYMAGLSHIAYIKMGLTDDTAGVRDMDQASLAIDAFKAMLEASRERIGAQDASALEGALSSMQMTFAQASAAGSDADDSPAAGSSSGGEEDEGGSDADRLWVPGKE